MWESAILSYARKLAGGVQVCLLYAEKKTGKNGGKKKDNTPETLEGKAEKLFAEER